MHQSDRHHHPNGVTSIGSLAFSTCTSLASIHIPASVTSIGINVFWGCSGLNYITVESGNTKYDSRNDCNALIEKETNKLIKGSNNTVIPDNVTTIGDHAFKNCTGLTGITIPASVTSIDGCAFEGCTALASIEIPASVTSIGGYAFKSCTALASITILDGVTTIGYRAFEGCTALASITIPASVTSIGNYAFRSCSGLESFSVAAENTTYDSRNNCNALIKTETNTLIQGCKNTVIPDGVTTIGSQAFFCCTGLTSIEIPASVTYIGGYAFQGCTSLTSVTIYPPSLPVTTVFGDNASDLKIYVFSDCVDTYKERAPGMGVDEDDILPIESISLKDAVDNSSLITAADGASLAVTLEGRTLYKDGAWNTLCLPFDVTIAGSVLAGDDVDVRTLSTTSFDAAKGELTLNFTPAPGQTGAVTTLQAGKPYIIKWTKPSGYVAYNGENAATCSDIVNPVFTGVTVSSTAVNVSTGYVDFIGTFSPEVIYEDGTEKHNLYLGADNKLYYPTAENFKVNACRGYFQLKGLTAGEPDTSTGVRAFVLNFGDEETTGIVDIEHGTLNMEHSADAGWYDLSGRKLYGKPTKKGLYIHQGKKIAIK